MADQLITGTTLIEDKRRTDFGLVWSCTGTAFKAQASGTSVFYIAGTAAPQANEILEAVIEGLPNGAIVTGVIVYGNDSVETWTLNRLTLSNKTVEAMASANQNTEDTSISNATIDNSSYGYFIVTSGLNSGDEIYGARITYKT